MFLHKDNLRCAKKVFITEKKNNLSHIFHRTRKKMSLLHKNTKSRKIQKINPFAPYGFYYLHFFTEKSINTEIILCLLKKNIPTLLFSLISYHDSNR